MLQSIDSCVKKGIRRPISNDFIAGSGMQLIEVTYFLKLSADQFVVFNWSRPAQGHLLKVEFSLLSS